MNLPKVYQNKNLNINNDKQDFFYGNKKETKKRPHYSRENIENKIKHIFNSSKYVYKIDVNVIIGGCSMKKTIIGITKHHLITLDNELINISDIEDIDEI